MQGGKAVSAEKTAVHQLNVSDDALDLMINAIAVLSRNERSFATLKDVVTQIIKQDPGLYSSCLTEFPGLLPLAGANRVYLRLSSQNSAALDQLKDILRTHAGKFCSVREAVCFCCLAVTWSQN